MYIVDTEEKTDSNDSNRYELQVFVLLRLGFEQIIIPINFLIEMMNASDCLLRMSSSVPEVPPRWSKVSTLVDS